MLLSTTAQGTYISDPYFTFASIHLIILLESHYIIYNNVFTGMADPLSFVLGNGGYRAYKYVPWGRVEEVMPYLIRRAQVFFKTSSVQRGSKK